ncbi:MAG: dTDP-glucose 4,6-dehydratase [Desulfobacterales bacterium SG8_35_2]|nr:MAG: dTDP-glucose 4,6-dehydratase [Desulfobacterales bacterium SG8_35_2]
MTSQHSALSTQHSLLVTGGAGFIGANFAHYWSRNYPDDRVLVLDALTYAGNRANLETLIKHPGFLFVHVQDQEIDTIVHFAAESHVDRSIHGPDAFVDTNITGTHTLLKAAQKVWLDSSSPHSSLLTPHSPYRFHHISTDEVYGSLGLDDSGFSETTPYAPNSPYAASKAGSDFLVRAYYKTYGLPMTISNCSNNYGPYQHPEKLMPLLILNCLEGKPLPIYGDGLNIRDWLYVEDHCRGIDLILKKGRIGETYNIGGNCEKTNLDVVEALCALMDELSPKKDLPSHSSLLTYVKDRPGHDRRYAIDASKIRQELGYEPVESFESGLRKTVVWYLENLAWCKNVMGEDYQKWLEKNYS